MGSFDYLADQMELPGARTGRPPATFGESFGWALDIAKQQTPFGGSLQLSDKKYERAKTIRDLTGDNQLFSDLVGNPNDFRHPARIAELAKQYPGFVKTDAELLEEQKKENAKTRQDAAYATQETTAGGTLGGILGGMAGGVIYDPTIWMSLPLGANAASGILRRAAVEAGINWGAEMASMAASSDWRKRMEDPITGDEFLLRSAMATGVGGVVGAGAGLLAKISKARAPLVEAAARPDARVAAAPPVEAASRPVIDLAEGDRVLNGRAPFRTVSEAEESFGSLLELRDAQARDPQAFAQLKAEYGRLDPTAKQLQFEDLLLENERFIAGKLEEQKALPRSATSTQRAKIAKEIEDATFYKENLDDIFRRDAEFARAVDEYPHTTQAERDAAQVIDDYASLEASSPFRASDGGFQNHVIAVGKAIDDIDKGRPVDVTDIVNKPVERPDGTTASPRVREEWNPKGNLEEDFPSRDFGGPDDFPKAPQPEMQQAAVDAQWDEMVKAAEREYDELIAAQPDRKTGLEVGQADKMRNQNIDVGQAQRMIEDLKLTESEIAAVKACMIGGGE